MNAPMEPTGLGDRGSRLFRELAQGVQDPLITHVIVEAARAADRLDDLDRVVQGEGVLGLMQAVLDEGLGVNPDAKDINVTINLRFGAVLTEARNQQDNFRKLLSEISRLKKSVGAKTETTPGPTPATAPGVAVEDELARRRQARQGRQAKA